MTIYQIQCLLCYLKPGVCAVDGVYGTQTAQAIKDFQSTYGLVPDGDAGPLTQKMMLGVVSGTVAKKEKQAISDTVSDKPIGDNPSPTDAEQYLQSDGCYHIPRGVDVQLSRNFWAKEIHCQGVGCCTESIISKRVMETAQAIRDKLGEPLSIGTAGGSGFRCAKHNADPSVGGSANSLHVSGNAVDLHYRNPAKLKIVALDQVHDGEIGLYSWGCHVGVWDRGYVSQFNGG